MIRKPTPPVTLLDHHIRLSQQCSSECRRMVEIAGGYPLGGDERSAEIGQEWAALELVFERVEMELKSGLVHAHNIENHAARGSDAKFLRRAH